MLDFEFSLPTKIYFGKGKEKELSSILKAGNFSKVMLVIGMQSVRNSPIFSVVTEQLKDIGVSYVILDKVRPNPTIARVNDGLMLAKQFNPELILAIGGGSVIDTAKSISVGYFYEGNPFDFNLHKAVPQKALPVGVILTISAAGSETSNSCVIQDDLTGKKCGFNSELVRPVFAIENPELTYSVPDIQTKYGIVDMFMHTLERYMQSSDEIEPADGFAETVLRSIIAATYKVLQNPYDYDARAILMSMSSFAHNDLTNLGKKKALPVHQLEHAVSGVYPNVTHAAGLAILWPAWAHYYLERDYDVLKYAKLAKNVFGINSDNPKELAQKGIQGVEDFFTKLGMPKTLTELGVKEEKIDLLIDVLTNQKTRTVFHHSNPIDAEQAAIIFRSVL